MIDSTIRAVLEPEDERPHAGDEYEVTGAVISLIALRNRRVGPDGEDLTARITEAMTRYHCNGPTGIGMSEYLDQVVAGWPTGPDVLSPARREEVAS